MRQEQGTIRVSTKGKGFYDISREVRRWVEGQKIASGLLTVFIQHTSASLTIQENADPDVQLDMKEFFERLVPENAPWYRHTMEGPDDMPSHIRTALTSTQISVPVRNGAPALGTWQAIYVFEHRSSPMQRDVLLHLMGE